MSWIYDNSKRCYVFRNGGIVKAETGWTAYINPMNWGVSRYDKDGEGNQRTFNQAYKAARDANEKEFLWNGNRYSTDYKYDFKYSVNPDIYTTKFTGRKNALTTNDYKQFAEVMTPIFREVMEAQGIPLTHLNNLVRQAGLESGYGTDPRGAQGYNLGGIKWQRGTRGERYKKTRHSDGVDYIDFDNLKDYADYKVWLLKNTYNAFDATSTLDFVDRLHGNNPEKKSYSTDKQAYIRTLTNTRSLNRYLNPKYDFQK